jgi:uncharacterized protein YdeI (YjbR/CyaY-like superfamily)
VPTRKGSESAPIFFKGPGDLRRWLEANHAQVTELWVGFWKKSTGKPSLTWQECVDELLCFGWIDGVRKSIDADSYKQRVTPRRPTSIWSRINSNRVAVLTAEDPRTEPLAAFEKRNVTAVYSFEQDGRAGLGARRKPPVRTGRHGSSSRRSRPTIEGRPDGGS